MSPTQTRLKFRCKKRASVEVCKENEPTVLKQNVEGSTGDCIKVDDENVRRSGGKRQSIRRDEKGNVSPPKRDKLSSDEKSPSPSQRLGNLHINDRNSGEHILPKRLFDKGSCFRQARQALHSSTPSALPGRETEIQELKTFLSEKLKKAATGTLYISGPPGTGKTACLTSLLQDPEFKDFRSIYVNCTSMKSSGTIYSRICEELKLKVSGKGEKEYLQVLDKFWNSNKKMTILILDEIDQLESKRQSVLYTIFEWPSKLNSHLVLIGVANALDLTDRILPRLQAHLKLKPELMHFASYTKEQIVRILAERLKEMDVTDVFSPSALQLLAGKVASVSGDIRRALDIGRRVLELAEAEKLSQIAPLQPSTESASNTSSPRKKTNGSVHLKIVMDVLNSVYGTSQSLCKSNEGSDEDNFPLQHKLLVCTLLLLLKKGKTKDVSVGKLHEVYRKVCKKRNLVAVSLAEFFGVCQLVETKGLLQVQTKKETRLAKVRLMWDEEEVATALKDKHLLAAVLSDTTVL
ncbi:hypothetical protein R5R35_002965 [Gryllus longicercus]|uniref:Cell division control protein n=1 Tax=Gryllus longicercus TaxID=2509291 RepID=A0AAN9V253_9ORTH